MRVVWCWTLGVISQAARLDVSSKDDIEGRLLNMLEEVATAEGYLNTSGTVTGNSLAEINKKCESEIWPAELNSKFTNRKVVGSGATACVWIATDDTGTRVAVKVGKGSNGKSAETALAGWRKECFSMQLLRLKGCKENDETFNLMQQYVPTCTEVGPTSTGAFYVMHAAGTTGIKDAPELNLSVSAQKSIFAQFIASVWALHAVDTTHNDLHGQNIVLDGSGDSTHLALIDFGELKSIARSWKVDYKRDSNAVWRWAAVLARCPDAAQWPNWKTSKDDLWARAAKFKSCMTSKWEPDDHFMKSLDQLIKSAINEGDDHFIKEMYYTAFVESNLPKPKTVYPAKFAEGCRDWEVDDMEEKIYKVRFSQHFKCDTVPSYSWTKTSTKRGKTRTREERQCQGLRGACFGLNTGELWQCDGGIAEGTHCGHTTGACLMPRHPAYYVAKPWDA